MITPTVQRFAVASTRTQRLSPATVAASASSTTEAHRALHPSAIAADAEATTEISLASVWRDLARGRGRIVDGFFSESRCYLVLSLPIQGERPPLDGRRLKILEAILCGVRQKNIAIDLRLAPSTVALNSRLALESLGMVGKPSRAHPLLMLAAGAAAASALVLARCSTLGNQEGEELRVISAPRPDLALATLLPSAEMAVVRCLVEGSSYQEIAQQRGTSLRTVANQISAVFRRLHVSGRNELVQQLASYTQSRPSVEPTRKTLMIPTTFSAPVPDSVESRRCSA